MIIYADTSVLVSLYLPDAHSSRALQLMATNPRIWLTPFHRAEWTHAVGQQMFQRTISPDDAEMIYEVFRKNREAGIWMEVDMPDEVFDTCVLLARKHTARLGTRTIGHVACCDGSATKSR